MSLLFDAPGPQTRRRHRNLAWVIIALLVIVGTLLLFGLARSGQFAQDLWAPLLTNSDFHLGIGRALLGTLRAAVVGMLLALLLGVLLASGRLSHYSWLNSLCTGFIWFFRGPPLLILILFFFLGFPYAFNIDLNAFWALVLSLMLYNGSVLAEIFRSGVLALPRGQAEAASSLGLSGARSMWHILLPQAVRNMLPAIISQLVVLLKDTSLGFVVSYFELLRYGNTAIQILHNPIQIYVLVAAIFIAVNFALSRLARWLERRGKKT